MDTELIHVQNGTFDKYFSDTEFFAIKGKGYFMGISEDGTYRIYSIDDNGSIITNEILSEGSIKGNISTLNIIKDTYNGDIYLYVTNSEQNLIALYIIKDNLSLYLCYSLSSKINNVVGMFYIVNNKLFYYRQSHTTKAWEIDQFDIKH